MRARPGGAGALVQLANGTASDLAASERLYLQFETKQDQRQKLKLELEEVRERLWSCGRALVSLGGRLFFFGSLSVAPTCLATHSARVVLVGLET